MEQLEIRYDGLREWLKELESLGDLKVAENADCLTDIGMVAAMLAPSATSPAVIFDNIIDYPKGYRVLVNSLNSYRRIALALGLPLDCSGFELSERLLKAFDNLKPIPPVFVDKGPVMENIQLGKEVNVLKFPVPKWHERAGGRFIGTGGYDIQKDPDEDWVNLGTYRVMVHNERQVAFYISPGKHGSQIRDKYFSRNEACPVAVVAGGDPLLFLTASSAVPYGICEYDWAGGLRGKPYQVFKGKVTGLPLPADAEIILEGFSPPDITRKEGPTGEWSGYYADDRDAPVIEVKAVYHRNDPIIVGSPSYRPPDEHGRFQAIYRSALLRREMEAAGVPGITAVWRHEAGKRYFIVIAIEQRYPGHSTQAGHAAMSCRSGAYAGRYVIVVDDDIDVSDLDEVIWALCTRCDPETDIDLVRRAWSTRLDPTIHPEDIAKKKFFNSRAIIDATRPFEWKDQFPKVSTTPEMIKQAKEKWGFLLRE